MGPKPFCIAVLVLALGSPAAPARADIFDNIDTSIEGQPGRPPTFVVVPAIRLAARLSPAPDWSIEVFSRPALGIAFTPAWGSPRKLPAALLYPATSVTGRYQLGSNPSRATTISSATGAPVPTSSPPRSFATLPLRARPGAPRHAFQSTSARPQIPLRSERAISCLRHSSTRYTDSWTWRWCRQSTCARMPISRPPAAMSLPISPSASAGAQAKASNSPPSWPTRTLVDTAGRPLFSLANRAAAFAAGELLA